jgi:phosphoribosylformylglycinamidine cyclo-ligase
VELDRGSWPVPAVFEVMRGIGNVSEHEMHRTFNMGVGMVVVCAPQDAASIEAHLRGRGEDVYTIGRVVAGSREVRLV